jgi:hypothetical protein
MKSNLLVVGDQSSIEILFAVCHGPGRRSAEPFKAFGCLF